MKKRLFVIITILFLSLSIIGYDNTEQLIDENVQIEKEYQTEQETEEQETENRETAEELIINEKKEEVNGNQIVEETTLNEQVEPFTGYKMIKVDGGNLSGYRESNVVADVGFGDREYWAFTNEYGQLIRVIADEIILQDYENEPVNSDGRYYNDEAKVPGVESDSLDEGHVIADSLGGVSSAYNITPQNSTLNRHGDQAYMEKVIRDAGGCTNFEAIIIYSNTETQIPSKYKFTYTLMGNVIVDEFENVNPDEYNSEMGLTGGESTIIGNNEEHDIKSIDTNGNGQVSIKEAKAAGFRMPITKGHWLYKYMTDGDGDGMVGE